MSVRTDLAVECLDENPDKLPRGIKRKIRKSSACEITEIIVEDDIGSAYIGKEKGRYVTIETDRLSAHPEDFEEQAENVSDEIKRLLGECEKVLVAGLGNRSITPDALGPLCASQIIATRHLGNVKGLPELSEVTVLSPGVMGQTGVEAAEQLAALCEKLRPTAVIAIDALACSEISRLGTTVQITDTGISPGSGVQNRRKELSRNTLGAKVIAIGVPTVIDLHTAAENLTGKAPEKDYPNMMITPRDIDELIKRTAKLIAFAVNRALQKNLTPSEIMSLM